MLAEWSNLNLAAALMEREAADFLRLHQSEVPGQGSFFERLAEIRGEIAATGLYTHTLEELEFGARVAWRNSVRCVGRLYWLSLTVIDARHLTTFDQVSEALDSYLCRATNRGNIVPTLLAFAPQRPGQPPPRIWNEQLVRYAGYRQKDGAVLGDPRQVEITERIQSLGWKPRRRTAFDILPVVVELSGQKPRWFHLSREAVLEVPLSHPDAPTFAGLGLRWHAVPSISSMRLELGGISYTMAPFNGWYMSAEIGARNLGDESRYNLLPKVAELFGLDTRKERTLWRDRALVELNRAVLHSFERAKVKVVDHHTASEHFLRFEEREAQCGRKTYAEWSWVVPPISGSVSPLFHHPFENLELTPNFFVQPSAWERGDLPPGGARVCPFHPKSPEAEKEPPGN